MEVYENPVDASNVALSEMRLQFDTLAEMQKEERIELAKIHKDEMDSERASHEKQIKHLKHIIIGLILTLCLIIGGIIGCCAYVLTSFDTFTFFQDASIGGDGESNIHDGIHFNGD